MYACMYVCIYVCTCVCMYVCKLCTCIYACMYVHIALDFSQLHEITSILDKANLSSVPAFKITEHFNPSTITTSCSSSPSLLELYIVRVRIDSDHVLGVLVDIGQFTSAREFAKVAGVPVADVTLKEVCLIIYYNYLHYYLLFVVVYLFIVVNCMLFIMFVYLFIVYCC